MRILVTGLDGFTGCYIKTELESHGHDVIAFKSDLTDPVNVDAEIAKILPEAVVHLAGIAFVGHGSANAFYEVNTIGTRNLLASIAKHAAGIKSILLVSSANVYGNRSEGILDETMTPEPANDYAVSKFAMEQMAHLWFDQLPITIVRPFNYTGVGQEDKYLIPKIVSHFKNKNDIIELGNLEVWREFGDVRSVVDIYRQLIEISPAGKTLNICTGQSYSLKEIVHLCEKITGHSIEIKVNPEFVRQNEIRELKGDSRLLDSIISDKKSYSLHDTLSWMLSK